MSQSPVQALQGLRDAVSALAQTLYEAENSPDLVFVKAQAEAGGPSSPAATGSSTSWPGCGSSTPWPRTWSSGWTRRWRPAATTTSPSPPRARRRDPRRRLHQVRGRADRRPAGPGREGGGGGGTAGGRGPGRPGPPRRRVDRPPGPGGAGPGGGRGGRRRGGGRHRRPPGRDRRGRPPTPPPPGPSPPSTGPWPRAARRVEELERAQADFPPAWPRPGPTSTRCGGWWRPGPTPRPWPGPRSPTPRDCSTRSTRRWSTGTAPRPGPVAGPHRGRRRAGRWKAAAGELDRWRRDADRWLADARRVAAANGAPVARRNELRGLLQAFRAKSLAMGRAEDPELVGLHHRPSRRSTSPPATCPGPRGWWPSTSAGSTPPCPEDAGERAAPGGGPGRTRRSTSR